MSVGEQRPLNPERDHTPLPRLVRAFWAASAAMFVLMFVVRSLERRAGWPEHFYYFFRKNFTDLLEYVPTFKVLHTSAFWGNSVIHGVAYAPFASVVLAVVYSFEKPLWFYLGSAAVGLVVGSWGVRRSLMECRISKWTALLFPLTMIIVCFPIVGLLQSGNVELYIWMLTAAGTWAYVREKNEAAAVLWALAGAMKLFPVVLLVLLLSRRKYRAFLVGAGSFAGAIILSVWYLGPDFSTAWHGWLRNVFGYQAARVPQWDLHELCTNHSMFGWAKFLGMITGIPISKLTLPYYALGAVIFAAVFFGRLYRMPEANQLIAVTAFMLMLPPVSYFYTLVHLVAPCVVLVFVAIRADRMGLKIPGLSLTLMLFVPLFACFMLFTFPAVFLFGGLVQAGFLALLFLVASSFPLAVTGSGSEIPVLER